MSMMTRYCLTWLMILPSASPVLSQVQETLPFYTWSAECLTSPPPPRCFEPKPGDPPIPPPPTGGPGGIHQRVGQPELFGDTILVPKEEIMKNFRTKDFNIEGFSNPMQLR